MTTTIVKQNMPYEEFLNYENDTGYLYELEDGELTQSPLESFLSLRIAMFLVAHFLKRGIPSNYLYTKLEVAVPSDSINVRLPDLTVLSKQLYKAAKETKRSLITLDMPAPDLVVEVVSPNQA
ncbi:MAG: Uma2 family endonuclease, partial [Cyanobacteria bacterium KgW148]|nr:Uma2 family endonuclease [Cyanobacteria bacterium KgW148]